MTSDGSLVFRPKKSFRNSGITWLLVSLGLMSLAVSAIVSERNEVGPLLLIAGIGCFFAGIAVTILLAYWRESLSVNDEWIIQAGIFRCRRIALSKVTDVQWRGQSGGTVILCSESQRIKIYLANFEQAQRRCLIRLLHRSLSPDLQRGWGEFCLGIALPLTRCLSNASIGDHEVLVTRKRWDAFFLRITLLCLAAGIVCAIVFKTLYMLGLSVVPAPLWLLIRFSTPPQGQRYHKIMIPATRFLWFLLLWLIVGLSSLYLSSKCPPWVGNVMFVVWMIVLLYQAHQVDRKGRVADAPRVPCAIEEWNRLENEATEKLA